MFLCCEENSTEVQENLELVDLIMKGNSAQHIRVCEEELIWYCSSQNSQKYVRLLGLSIYAFLTKKPK